MNARTRINKALTLAVLAMATLALMAAPAGAAVIVVDSTQQFSMASGSGLQLVTGLGTFDAGGASKLVVVVSTEHAFNNTDGHVHEIQYNGVSLIEAVQEHASIATSAIFYLDNPGPVGTGLWISAANPNGGIGAAYALKGTAEGVGVTSFDQSNSVSITTTVDDSLVIANIDNSGSPNYAGTTTADAPLTQVSSGIWGGGREWGSQASGYQHVAVPSTITPTFTTKVDPNLVLSTIAAAFEPGDPPPVLTLHVNTTSGATALLGDPNEAIAINYYQITSDADSLDAAGWRSLADQDFEGSGPPDGSGDGWEEAGGVGPHALAEAFLLGDSTIGAAASVGLGKGFDAGAGAEDLALTFRTDAGDILDGPVEYFSPLPGDVDNDGDVDNADIGKVAGSFTGAGGSTAETWADGDVDGDGDVDNADIGLVVGLFTGVPAGGAYSGPAGGETIPEPATLFVMMAAGLPALLKRRRA